MWYIDKWGTEGVGWRFIDELEFQEAASAVAITVHHYIIEIDGSPEQAHDDESNTNDTHALVALPSCY